MKPAHRIVLAIVSLSLLTAACAPSGATTAAQRDRIAPPTTEAPAEGPAERFHAAAVAMVEDSTGITPMFATADPTGVASFVRDSIVERHGLAQEWATGDCDYVDAQSSADADMANSDAAGWETMALINFGISWYDGA